MLRSTDVEVLCDKVCRLLWDVGMRFENEELAGILLKKGCSQAPSKRIRIPKELIDELTAYQKTTQEEDQKDQELHFHCGVDWAHSIIWNGKQEEMRERLKSEFLMSAFDCGPTTYYDYREQEVKPVNTEIFTEMMKLAQATPEVGYTSTWYRQDVPPQIERIESLAIGARLTSKLDGIECIYPEVIKYLVEASQIITERPGDSSYLAGSECFTPPLIMERRSCKDMLERIRCGVHRYHIASMPTVGVNTPVTVAGSIVMYAAEILGGEVAAWCLDPESDISGRMICLLMDMRNANSTPTGPEAALLNLGIRELFDAQFGGHLWVEVFFSPVARRPGLQAVFENHFGRHSYSKWIGNPAIPYPGMGTLHNGGIGSPTQLMLDMDIRRAEWHARPIEVNDETLNFDEVCERVTSETDWLTSEHTLRHFRELWSSPLFLTDDPTIGKWDGTERAILDKCEEMWRANLANYEPPEWPDEKLKALDDLVKKAKKEFSVD